MKIIVTGSLGNISQLLAQELIKKGHEVTIITSNILKQQQIEMMGARAAVGSVTDVSFLKDVFNGADAVYGMTPPNFGALNNMDYYREIAQAYLEAINGVGVKRFVYLSSYGADLTKGSGMILGSHYGEAILNELKDVNLTFLRPGYFFYNLLSFLKMIKNHGFIGSNFGSDDKLIMVSPVDIASAAAEELTSLSGRKNIRYIVSDERTCSEVARTLGEAIGKPDLAWITFTDEQALAGLIESGIPVATAELIVELGAGIHTGILRRDYETCKPILSKTKLDTFVPEFLAAYNKI